MNEKLFEILNKKFNEQVEFFSQSLSDGVAKDYADYKEMCGVIKGLRTAQLELNDLLRKIKESDDE